MVSEPSLLVSHYPGPQGERVGDVSTTVKIKYFSKYDQWWIVFGLYTGSLLKLLSTAMF